MRSSGSADGAVNVVRLGRVDYEPTWRAMQSFTAGRDESTVDELWLLEHPSVYTVGVAGRSAHLPRVDNGIPVVFTDRGGQITYHGPGQIVIYTLLDLGPYPALVPSGAQAIAGELWDVDGETLRALDDFEGHPDLYVRAGVSLACGSVAEAYFLTSDQARRTGGVIAGGDWRLRRAR